MKKLSSATLLWLFLPLLFLAPLATAGELDEIEGFPHQTRLDDVDVEGLVDNVVIRRDFENVPHIFTKNEPDAFFMQGWVHAQDRLFQMDTLRRTFSGTLAELIGAAALGSDVQLRTLGLRRSAEATLPVLGEETRAAVEAYAAGVNAYLAQAAALPPEYGALSLTSVAPWTPVDSLVIGNGIAFGLSFDLADLDFTEALLTIQAAGSLLGFDGTALFSEDLYRSAPFDPSISIPGFLDAATSEADAERSRALAQATRLPKKLPSYLDRGALELIRGFKARLDKAPGFARYADRRESFLGSNWWVASGAVTESGYPVLANDPHLSLETPSIFYEVHLWVSQKFGAKPMNVVGVSFAGAPGVILGCNRRICWGATVNPMDVTDVYLEELVVNPVLGPTHTMYQGQAEPLVPVFQAFQVNALNPAAPDTLVDAGVGPTEGGVTLLVPRRNNGPLVQVLQNGADPTRAQALSVQYTGFGVNRLIETFYTWARARNLEQFQEGLHFFDTGSQNFSYADVAGNVAYFTSAEMPLREDLQTLNAPDGGIPPWLIRDGTGTLRHEWMPLSDPQPFQSTPFEILPFEEMPQVVNPASGYVLNCNNDPVGTTVDNNPLNQLRPGGGLYYLNPGYATGHRMGRIQRLFGMALEGGGKLSVEEIRAFQANNQLLDAEVLTPYILAASANATADGAAPALAALGADPGVAEAVGRLAAWDFSTPTGVREGYDPGDDPNDLPAPSAEEAAASVAATIYSIWRGQMVQNTIDATLARLSAPLVAIDPALDLTRQSPGSSQAVAAVRNLLDNFDTMRGTGASGVNFFDTGLDDVEPETARDLTILQSLRDALDLLASDTFAAAFNNSTVQDEYRWGYLHRIVFDHLLGGPFNIPAAGGLANMSEDLPGVARSGGFGALDASSHSARADGVNEFMFGSGPARRFVGEMLPGGVDAVEVIPGGESGVLGDPYQADQLLLWLTNDYPALRHSPPDVASNSRTYQKFSPKG